MTVVGITGGVGAGKSEVLNFLEENYNVEVLHSDDLAKQLILPGHACYDIIRQQFHDEDIWGGEVASAPGKPVIDKGKLAKLIFSDEAKRKKYDGIVRLRLQEPSCCRIRSP